jgi:hypothetical protein
MPKKPHPFADGGPAHIDWDEDHVERKLRIRGGGYAIAIDLERFFLERGGPKLRANFLESRKPASTLLPANAMRELFMLVLSPNFHGHWAKVTKRPESPFRKRMRITISSHRRRLKRLRPQ